MRLIFFRPCSVLHSDEVDGSPTASGCAKMVLSNPDLRRAVHGEVYRESVVHVTRVGRDLAKNIFQVHGVDASGQTVIVRKLRRSGVVELFGRLRPAL